MCFVVFYGVLWCFAGVCGVLRVFCGVLRVFCSISTKHTKKTEKHRKTLKNTKKTQYARVLRSFSKSKKNRLYCTKLLSQNICKTPQNTVKHHKTVTKRVLYKTRFVKLRRKTPQNNNAKRSKKSQNGRNTAAIRIARIRCIIQKYFRPVAKVHDAQYA